MAALEELTPETNYYLSKKLPIKIQDSTCNAKKKKKMICADSMPHLLASLSFIRKSPETTKFHFPVFLLSSHGSFGPFLISFHQSLIISSHFSKKLPPLLLRKNNL